MNIHTGIHSLSVIMAVMFIVLTATHWLIVKTVCRTWPTGRKLAPWEDVLRNWLRTLDHVAMYACFMFLVVAIIDIVIHVIKHLLT